MFSARWRPHICIRLDAPSCQAHAKTPLFPCEDKLGPCQVKREWNLPCTLTTHTLTMHLGQISCKPSHVNYAKKKQKPTKWSLRHLSIKDPTHHAKTTLCKLLAKQTLTVLLSCQAKQGSTHLHAHATKSYHAKLWWNKQGPPKLITFSPCTLG